MTESDISYFGLAAGILTLIIPFFILQRYKTGLLKPAVIAFGRMIIQLIFVGIYLKYIFDLNSPVVNFLWVLIMVVTAGISITKRSNLNLRIFVIPIIISVLANVVINLFFYSFLILDTTTVSSARYLIPIMGMTIGNTLTSSIVGIRSYTQAAIQHEEEYRYYLMLGATSGEAQFQFITRAFREAFNPVIASNAVIGLIWLPGMMTGQILGGSNPFLAIKYQISIIITIFVGSVVTVFVAINLLKRTLYDEYGNLKKEIIVK
jgi:putative ABC transport system permease protein